MPHVNLLRAWARQLAAASGAALLAPLTVAGALAVLAITGGFASLGSRGQLVTGPRARTLARTSGKQPAPAPPVFTAAAPVPSIALPVTHSMQPAPPAPALPPIAAPAAPLPTVSAP
jgi:hypothetical protein